jgi:hypothetical protein
MRVNHNSFDVAVLNVIQEILLDLDRKRNWTRRIQ